jgi:hypothetical protein
MLRFLLRFIKGLARIVQKPEPDPEFGKSESFQNQSS